MTRPKPDDLDAVRKVVDALDGFEPAEQERIIRWACEKVGLAVQSQPTGSTPPISAASSPESREPASTGGGVDIKSFFEEKSPASDTQFAATVAYYYRFQAPQHLRKESITADDLQEACRLVGHRRLARPAQTLINALAQGFLDRGERGTYTINTVGENLVAMALPAGPRRVTTARSKRSATAKQPTAPAKRANETKP